MSGKARPPHTEKDFPDELLQSIFAQAADGIFVADDQGRYIDVNPCGCEMLGYTRQEILKLSIRDLIPSEDLSNNPLHLDELRAGRTTITERRLCRRDGTFLPVEISARMLSNGNLLGIVRDISKRKRAERLLSALNRSAEAMAGALTPEEVFSAASSQLTEAGIHCIVLPLDESNNCYIPLYLSIAPKLLQRLEKLTGIKHEDFTIPIDVLDVFVQIRLENRAVFVENTETLVRQVLPEPLKGLASKIVKFLRVPKFIAAPMFADDTFYGIFSAEASNLTENDLPSITAFAHQMAMSLRKAELFQQAQDEIAERKHAEEISRKSEERYHFLFENMLDGFAYCRMIFDKKNQPVDFIYLDVNKAFESLTGLKDVIKKRVTEVIPGIRKSNPELFEIYGNVALTGKPQKFETYLPELDIWLSISTYCPEKDHFVAIFENITEQKRAEKIQETIYKISQTTVLTTSLEELYRSVHSILGELMSVENFYIALYDPASDLLSFPYFVDQYDDTSPPKKPGRGLTEYVLRTGEPLFASPEVFERLKQQGEVELVGANSIDWLGVPLKVTEQTVGVMATQSYTEEIRFNHRDLELMEFVSTQVATAIERKRAEDSLKQSEARYRLLFDSMIEGFALHEIICNEEGRPVDYRFLEVNPAFERLTGLRAADMIDRTVLDVLPGTETAWIERYGKVALTGASTRFEDYSRELDCHYAVTAYCPQRGQFAVIFEDITERKRAELRIQHLTRLYATLSQVNQMIVRVKEPDELFQSICKLAVEYGKFGLAWIGIIDHDTGAVTPVARHGEAYDLLPFQTINYKKAPFKQGLIGKAVNSGKVTYIRNMQTDPTMQHWRDLAVKADFHTTAVIPFRREGRIIGFLKLYVTDLEFFEDEEQQSLLNEMALDISFALDGMERESRRKRAEEALRLSEEHFANAFEYAAIGIALVAPNGRFLQVNRALCDLVGYEAEELLSKTFQDITHPEDLQTDLSYVRQMLAGEIQTYQMEKRYFHKYGQVICVLLSVSLVRDSAGQPLHFISQIQDITNRKQAEAERERLLNVLEASLNEIYIFHPHTLKIEYANKGALLNLRYTLDQLKAMTPLDLKPEFDEASFQNLLQPMLNRERELLTFQTVHRRSDGSLYPVEVYLQLIEHNNEPVFLAVILDITERKQLEQYMQESEEKYRTLFNEVGDGIVLYDGNDGHLVSCNPEFERITGRPLEKLIGQRMWDLRLPALKQEAENIFQTLVELGQIGPMESAYERPDGQIVPVEYKSKLISMNDQPFALSTARDITERIQAEKQIKQKVHELEILYQTSIEINAQTELDFLLPVIVERAASLMGVEAGGLFLIEPNTQMLKLAVGHGPLQKYVGTRIKLGEGLSGRVAQNKEVMAIEDYTKWEGKAAVFDSVPLRRILGVPLKVKDKIIGVINVSDLTNTGSFSEDEIRLGCLFADQAAIAIENSRLIGQEQSRSRELATLYEATKAINSDLALDAVLETVAEMMMQVSRSDGCTLSHLDRDRDVVSTLVDYRSKYSDFVDDKGTSYSLSEFPATRHVIETGQPMVIGSKSTNADQAELAYMVDNKYSAVLMLPLSSRDNVVGLVELYEEEEEEEEREYTQEEIQLLQNLAAQAAIAIEKAQLFDDAQRRLRQTTALREIDQAIAGSMHVNLVLQIVLNHIRSELGVDAAVILLYDPHEQLLKYELGSGFRTDALQFTHLRLGEGYAGRAAMGRQTIHIPDLQTRNTDFLRSPTFHREGFACYFGVPLIAKGEIKGVLEIFHRRPLNPDNEWLEFMETLAGQVAIAIDNATLYRDLQRSNVELTMAYDATIEGWSHALDLRDKETEGHTQRVTELTMRMARDMGISEEELVHIQRGALLHDIGKMGIPDRILLKPDKLTEDEWDLMRKHPVFAYELLKPIAYLKPALDIPYCHHEKWDGTGYPRRLKGEDIPLAARIFAVIDVYDALTSDRPYRPAWTKGKTIQHIQEQAGTHFDPEVVAAFLRMIDKS